MSLTDTAIRSLKPSEKPRKHSDGEGLYLLVNPNGSKLWRMKYRYGGKEKTLSFGAYPATTLKDARTLRDEAKTSLAKAIDPSVTAKIEKAQRLAGGNSFKEIAEELLAKKEAEGKAAATMKNKRLYLSFAIADLGSRPINEIKAPEILITLRKLEKRDKLATAGRVRSGIGEVFRYAIATARAESDPTSALRGAIKAHKAKHQSAITDAKAFGDLLRAIDAYEGRGPGVKAALQLMALLYARPGELRQAEWKEFDLDKATWTIPASRAKMRRDHKKPLPPRAVVLLKAMQEWTGDGRYVFPSERTVKRPMSDMAMNTALKSMGFSKNTHVPHGFRTTASTLLNQSGKFNPDAIEAELAHLDSNAIRAAYHRGVYWDERVRMTAWWADECEKMRSGAELIQLKGRRA
ncbi:tyrosine-type recombinase/integrase [Rhizobium mongolense]|uniref:Integrase n=1 Tax=Rhizobium mongolense TaxID=57676 RepID=A0A7W6RVD2_9HYPH|nr:integrase arm-type DNA-binding domain-containing protein [Rhizobium mongolense]MBB4279311.1 integrase [Rhizobium mongolense]